MKILGHANYAEYGKDIVCASVSSLITCTVNNISVVDSSSVKYEDDGNKIYIEIINNNDISLRLFKLSINFSYNLSVICSTISS